MLKWILLRLLPAAFRYEYAAEMGAIYAQRRRDSTGVFNLAGLYLEMTADLAVTAVAAHWEILCQDVRQSLRTLRRSKAFTLTAIVVTALGVGATTAAFSIADHVLIRPLPFADVDRLVMLWENIPGYPSMEPSPGNYRDWKTMNSVFESMGAHSGLSVNLSGSGQPENISGACVTADLFPTIGAKPALGRVFAAADDHPGAAGTVVLSDGLWRDRFGGDPAILNRKILLDGVAFTVIGVMPRDFYFPTREARLWIAMRFWPSDFEDRANYYLHVVAKLRPGVSAARARQQMKLISAQLERLYPKDNHNVTAYVSDLRELVPPRSRVLLTALAAAALCLLLMACTNLANLLLARGLMRRKEIAVRTALGAGRERLVRQLLTESTLLALAGGLVGLGLAAEVAPLLAKLVPNGLPISETFAIDGRVIGLALVLTTLTGIGFGTIPALRTANAATSGLREGSRSGVGGRRERLRGLLVVAQVSSSVVLLICSGLLIRALWQIENVDPGFHSEGVLTLRTALPMPKYEDTAPRLLFYSQVLTGVRGLAGVRAAGYTSFLPIVMGGGIWPVSVDGAPPDATTGDRASLRFITPGYFAAMGIPVIAGRDVAESDAVSTLPVAIVSQSFARRHWDGQAPLGRHFRFAFSDRTVVGVVGDVRMRGLERTCEPQVYLPYSQEKDAFLPWYAPKDLAIRTNGDPAELVAAVRRIVASADPEQPVSDVESLADLVATDSAPRVVHLRVLGGFALLAFLLAVVGIHGLLSFAVSSRTQEIGVRLAIGARPANIFGMVLRQGAVLCGAGVVLGLAASYVAGKAIQAALAGVRPDDPTAFLAGSALAVAMALAGSILPALRAVRIDPLIAIRSE